MSKEMEICGHDTGIARKVINDLLAVAPSPVSDPVARRGPGDFCLFRHLKKHFTGNRC